jgi:threonine/homoserine/homoserine lactone efflux protein
MNSLGGIFFTSFLVGLSGALMPGPVLTLTVGQVVSRGFWAGPLIVLGHSLLELVLVGAVTLGLGPWLARQPVITTIALVGGGFLIYLGGGILAGLKDLTFSLELESRPERRRWVDHPVVGGILTSLSNPYWTVWWATIGLGYIAMSRRWGVAGLVSFYGGHILSDLGWYGLVALLLTWGRWAISHRIYRMVVGLCGLFLVGFGLYFALSGLGIFS